MPRAIHVHFLPDYVTSQQLAQQAVAVIDVLRATTTMVHALAAGALSIHPCLAVNEALELAETLGGDVLLCGERGGLRIESFSLGNSPAEFTPDVVGGRTLVMTTTNGTRAARICSEASLVVVAAFVNLRAVANRLEGQPVVHCLCAGTGGAVTREDCLLAGALVERLMDMAGGGFDGIELNDQAQLVLEAWLNVSRDMRSARDLVAELGRTQGGRDLIRIGAAGDIELAAAVDRFDLVPELDNASGVIALP